MAQHGRSLRRSPLLSMAFVVLVVEMCTAPHTTFAATPETEALAKSFAARLDHQLDRPTSGLDQRKKLNNNSRRPTVLCVAWVVGTGGPGGQVSQEAKVLPWLRCQLKTVCNHGLIYTDTESPLANLSDYAVQVSTVPRVLYLFFLC